MGRPSDARERLIGAAKEVIHANSYEAASVDELCAAAGVHKSSFYHFFSSKQELVLVALEDRWQQFEELALKTSFSDDFPPQEQILRFFDLGWKGQQLQQQRCGHVYGCPFGNLVLEMSTQNEAIRERLNWFFQQWLGYLERVLHTAKEQGIVPATLDITATAQSLLAYFEGAMLCAKGRNDPALMRSLRAGMLSLMQYQGTRQTV
ncbi:MAG TPA: TetR/AcrR family transcriptional regulator [Ktedonobacteraceae bacterium]